MLHLPKNIRFIRLVSKKTQIEFGKMFEATKAMIISYEGGKAKPDDLFMDRLAKYSGVSIEDIQNKKLEEKDIKIEKGEKVNSRAEIKPIETSFQIIAESNKILAESNKALANTNSTLVKRLPSIESVFAGDSADAQSKFSDLLELIAEIGAGQKKMEE